MIYEAASSLLASSTPRLFADPVGLDARVSDALKSFVRFDASRARLRALELKSRGANWDGRGSAAAKHASVDHAAAVLDTHMYQVLEADLAWLSPHVELNEDGDVVIEWWNGSKKLTLYVGETATEYVSSWGPDMDGQMDAGVLDGDLLQFWQWLVIKP